MRRDTHPKFFQKIIVRVGLLAGGLFLVPVFAEAAISFVGSAEGGGANSTDPTADLTTIAGLAENDLVVAACGLGDVDGVNANVIMNTAGYTGIEDLFAQDATHEASFEVFYKFMGASVDTSAVCEGGTLGSDAGTAIVVMAFRGVDTTTPFDVVSTSAIGTDDPDADPPSIDWSTTGVWTVIAAASAHVLNTNCASDAYVFPTGYTTDQIECASSDTTDISVGMGYNSGPADPEDPGVMDHNGTDSTSNAWAATTMALRPAIVILPPTISTDPATSVTASAATLNADLEATGGAAATTCGFAWGTDSGLLNGDTATTTDSACPGDTGAFTGGLAGLAEGTTYYFRAYGTNSAGTGFGSLENFLTSIIDQTPTRTARLFEGFAIKLMSGRVRILE